MVEKILEIKDLKVVFNTLDKKRVYAVNSISLDINSRETLAIVGESGSGKSQFASSLMHLLAPNAEVEGQINFEGQNILDLSIEELNKIRGSKISMIFQDPMTSLNPYLKISTQMTEILTSKSDISEKEAKEKAIKVLEEVSIPEPHKRIDLYPHQFSGGMRQRIMIAMALLSEPEILIADEPTTALDATIQAQILDILEHLKKTRGVSIIMITHDLGVVSHIADKIAVFYAGKIVEYGTRDEIFNNPHHPYTVALLNSIPKLSQTKETKLFQIKGMPSTIYEFPTKCSFYDRCNQANEKCLAEDPKLIRVSSTHIYECTKEK